LNVRHQAFRLAPEAIGFDTKNHVEDDKGYDEAYSNEACGPNQCGSGNHSVLDTEDEAIEVAETPFYMQYN